MNAPSFVRLLVFALCLALGACATQKHSRDLLSVTLYDYSGAVRWNRFDVAAAFLDPEVLAKKPLRAVDMERYAQVQVTGYTVQGSQQIAPDDLRQIVEIRLVNRHTQAERTIIDQQQWRYDAELRRWWLVSGLPNITETR